MNRRLFIKSIGATVAGVTILPSCTPEPTIKVADCKTLRFIKRIDDDEFYWARPMLRVREINA